MKKFLNGILIAIFFMALQGCRSVDNERIPSMPVYISLSDTGLWNTYGVYGFGNSRRFIISTNIREPYGFPYSSQSATGFGGVLLICGLDTYTGITDAPLAYDLGCPVERDPNVRVQVESELYRAVCPVCGSVYDVTLGSGAPLSGPAATGKYRYALKKYSCYPSGYGGYLITN